MASQLLIEGTLDAKGPRGSEDRKFLKVWRRQWTRFSVVYPSGRRVPYLLLTLSRSSSENPDKEIKLSRDGLRLFRCRSKSRPYRTWAITSGNKVILYFAAKSEIQAQNWMQAVRDGLWPSCFSFQMLTACSYEVSLVDDDNTFLAGLLGVYGRFVMTSEDVISLMHPHWGSTLLEISLDNVIDVLFIREAEISPAGIFSIILKRIEGSNVKALQFFCNTAKDAMQWILSKLYTRRKSFSSNGSKKQRGNSVTFLISDDSVSSNTDLGKNLDSEKTIVSTDDQLIKFQTDIKPSYMTDPITSTVSEPEYENLQSLGMNSFPDEQKIPMLDNDTGITELKNNIPEFLRQSKSHHFQDFASDSKVGDGNILQDFISNENTYANIINGTTSIGTESLKNFNSVDDVSSLNSEYANKKQLNQKTHSVSNNSSITIITDESVNKSYNGILNSFPNSNVSTNILPTHKEIDQNQTEVSKSCAAINHDPQFSECKISYDPLYGKVNKNASNDSPILANSPQYLKSNSLCDYVNSTKNNQHLLPSLASDFLDTSLNSLTPRSKSIASSSSSEGENEHLLLLVSEFDELKMNEQIYEDISLRKGTIYEEIDETEDEHVDSPLNAPELPERPTNLVIPESLKLQKLSKCIQHTLEVMDDTQSQKELRHPNFIKKIKDVNKITRLSPNNEYAKEPFTIESKLKINAGGKQVLQQNALKTSI